MNDDERNEYCYECTDYGGNYYVDENYEWVCEYDTCWVMLEDRSDDE